MLLLDSDPIEYFHVYGWGDMLVGDGGLDHLLQGEEQLLLGACLARGRVQAHQDVGLPEGRNRDRFQDVHMYLYDAPVHGLRVQLCIVLVYVEPCPGIFLHGDLGLS